MERGWLVTDGTHEPFFWDIMSGFWTPGLPWRHGLGCPDVPGPENDDQLGGQGLSDLRFLKSLVKLLSDPNWPRVVH